MLKLQYPLLLALCWILPRPALAESPDDLMIIANRKIALKTVELAALRQVFLGQRTSIANVRRVVAINAKSSHDARQIFQRRVLQMTADEERRYWLDRKVRTGASSVLPEFANVLKAVFKVRDSIGYVRRADYRPDLVKVLAVIPAKKARN